MRLAATIEHLPTHWAILTPAVPEVRELLRYPVVEFGGGGPLGHRMEVTESDWLAPTFVRRRYSAATERGEAREVQVVPQGLVPQVVDLLTGLGYAVEVCDRREDSPRWVRRADWTVHVRREHRAAVEELSRHRTLRVVGLDADRVLGTIAAAARAYPEARIAVGVPTYKLLWRVLRPLRARVGERLGLYTARQKTFGRVSVGLVGQLPRGSGEWDLLALPFAEQTAGDGALRVVMSGQYRRVLAFTRSRRTGDADLDRRLLVIAGRVWPEGQGPTAVTAVVLPTRGTRPGEMADAFGEKQQLVWFNDRRNRRIAEVAKGLIRARKKPLRALFGGDEQLAGQVATAAKSGVAILVETPVHARELAALLPGWAVWSADDLDPDDPKPGRGIIITERATSHFGIGAGVLVRATGTRWPLPKIGWPRPKAATSGVLVDFADDFHPQARANALSRIRAYEDAGMTVFFIAQPTEHYGATGASR
jgi:hypothetical protein